MVAYLPVGGDSREAVTSIGLIRQFSELPLHELFKASNIYIFLVAIHAPFPLDTPRVKCSFEDNTSPTPPAATTDNYTLTSEPQFQSAHRNATTTHEG